MDIHKVRLLADEATEWCKKHAHGAPTAWEWESKFAELIVKECAEVVAGDFDYQTNWCNEKILQHFDITVE